MRLSEFWQEEMRMGGCLYIGLFGCVMDGIIRIRDQALGGYRLTI